jgi:hypothetical protein
MAFDGIYLIATIISICGILFFTYMEFLDITYYNGVLLLVSFVPYLNILIALWVTLSLAVMVYDVEIKRLK